MEKQYSAQEVERLIVETTRHGAVYASLYFDAHGKSEDAVKNTLIDFVDRLSKEKGVLYCVGEILPPISREQKEGGEETKIFSTSSEVKVLAENFVVLLNICLRFAPVGAQINAPAEIRLPLEEAQSVLLDASQSTQEYSAYILKKVLKPEEFKEVEEKLARRAELGKQLLEKQKKD